MNESNDRRFWYIDFFLWFPFPMKQILTYLHLSAGPRRYLSNSSTLCAGKEATRQA